MHKKYVVELTEEEREQVRALTAKRTTPVRQYKRALVLLYADVGPADPAAPAGKPRRGDTDAVIAAKVGLHAVTIEQIRKRFVEEGLAAALTERPRPGAARKLDGRQEAHLLALACTAPPEGHKRWTMQLLAERLVALEVVDAISDETVRRTLKKGTSNPGSTRPGASRPIRTRSSWPAWKRSSIFMRHHLT